MFNNLFRIHEHVRTIFAACQATSILHSAPLGRGFEPSASTSEMSVPGILLALAMNLIASNLNLQTRHGQLHDQLPSTELSDLPLVLDF